MEGTFRQHKRNKKSIKPILGYLPLINQIGSNVNVKGQSARLEGQKSWLQVAGNAHITSSQLKDEV